MQSNIIVDLSHHNGAVDLAAAKGDGICGVIHKATQGLTFRDPVYRPICQKAKDNDLLWGAYHFGTGSDGVSQAEHFLEFVQPDAKHLFVLDFEHNPQGTMMTLDR
jgi:lysozyme